MTNEQKLMLVVGAVAVGLVSVGPQLFFALTSDYRGILLSGSSDELHYLVRVQDVRDGHPNLLSPYFAEYRNDSVRGLPAAEHALAAIGHFTGLPTPKLFLFGKFLFPLIAFLLAFAVFFQLTGTFYPSLFGGTFITLGIGLVSFANLSQEFLFLTRLPHPAFSSLFFFGWLLAISEFFSKRTWLAGMASGALLGILGYVYPFYWAFAVAASGLVFLWFFFGERDLPSARILALSLLLAALVDIPFLRLLFPFIGISFPPSLAPSFSNLDPFDLRISFLSSHRPVIDGIVVFALFVYGWFVWRYRKELSRPYRFPLFLLLAALLVSNQQILTGRVVQVGHFYWFTNVPVALMVLAVAGGFVVRRSFRERFAPAVASLGILIVLGYAMSVQVHSFRARAAEAREYQRYESVFGWLQNHSAKERVVFADETLSEFIPSYTFNNVYWSRYQAVYPAVPGERLRHNWFLRMRLEGVTAGEAAAYLSTHRNELGIWLFEGQSFKARCGSPGCFPDGVLGTVAEEYRASLERPFGEMLKAYRVDYVIWDRQTHPEWRLPTEVLTERDRIDDFLIYEIK